MKKIINGDSYPIKTIDDYNKIKSYTTNYIRKLLVNPRIRRKDSLRLLLKDLNKLGYIGEGWKFDFFMKLVMYEKTHKNSNIGNLIFDLKRFKRQHESKRLNPNLEQFFV